MRHIITALVWLGVSAGAPGGEMTKLSFRNPNTVNGAEDSIVRSVASAVIIPGSAHEDLWVHPNLVTVPGDPIQLELGLRSTDRRGGDKHTLFNYFRTDDDFQSLHPIDNPKSPDWRLIGLTSADFEQPKSGRVELPEGEWHWARNAAFVDSGTFVYPFLTRKDERRSVRTVTARQKGDKWVPLYVSNALTLEAGRGLLEPQIVQCQHRLFMTMRAEDGFGYVSVSGRQRTILERTAGLALGQWREDTDAHHDDQTSVAFRRYAPCLHTNARRQPERVPPKSPASLCRCGSADLVAAAFNGARHHSKSGATCGQLLGLAR